MGNSQTKVSRRRILQATGAASVAGLAGCGGDSDSGSGDGSDGGDGQENNGSDGSGDQELGERVPEPLEIWYFGSLGGITSTFENFAQVMEEDLGELFNHEIDAHPSDITALLEEITNDTRGANMVQMFHSPAPHRLDPHEMTRRWAIDWAGGNGRANFLNYANCEYSHHAVAQGSAGNEEERREHVQQAQEIFSEEVATVPLVPPVIYGVANTNAVETGDLGDLGYDLSSAFPYLMHESRDERFSININSLPTNNYFTQSGAPLVNRMSMLVNSPLAGYNQNLELEPILAEDWEVMDDFKRVEVTLRDATFHNGEPITAEDVKYTFEHVWDNVGVYPFAEPPEGGSVEVIDEKTAVFTMDRSTPALTTVEWPRWGIIHKESWVEGGGEDDPGNYDPETPVFSGPYKITEFRREEYRALDPHDGHPVYQPETGIDEVVYDSETAAVESFLAGELDVLANIGRGSIQRITSEHDSHETHQAVGFHPYCLHPQHSFGPTQFQSFRHAMGKALDRSLMNELAFDGESDPELWSTLFRPEHPWRNPDDQLLQLTDSPTGDIEGARQLLEDAGWGWDDDGNLRYPADVDPSPRWPSGELPEADEFACLSADGELDREWSP